MLADIGILFLIAFLMLFILVLMEVFISYGAFPVLLGRKLAHMAIGVFCLLSIPLMDDVVLQIAMGGIITFVAFWAIKTDRLSMNRIPAEKRSLGMIYFPFSFTVLLIMWGREWEAISMMSLLIMAFSDSFASLVGRYWGRLTYQLSGGRKSIEGSIAFFMTSMLLFFIVSLTPSFTFSLPDAYNPYPWWAGAIIISVLLTLVEALSIRGDDNISVPLLGSILLYHLMYDPSWEKSVPFAVGIAFSTILSIVSMRLRLLNLSGGMSAILLGAWIFGFGSWDYAVPILVFFVGSGILSLYKKEMKEVYAPKNHKEGRDLFQVLANGALPGLLLSIAVWQKWENFLPVYLSIFAAANADTWATEIGTAMKRSKTISITTFKTVEKGVSGGISLPGTIASIIGAMFISSLGFLLMPGYSFAYFAVVSSLGFVGSLVDSLLGDTWQHRYLNPIGQRSDYEHGDFKFAHGIPWLTNNKVNFLSGAVVAFIALFVFVW